MLREDNGWEDTDYEVCFHLTTEHLEGVARYHVRAESAEAAVRVARRRATGDGIPHKSGTVSVEAVNQ